MNIADKIAVSATNKVPAIADISRSMVELAQLANKSPDFIRECEDTARRRDETVSGPYRMFQYLLAAIGPEKMELLPEVGSERGKTGNRPYDKFPILIDGKEKVRSNIALFLDTVSPVQTLNATLDRIMKGEGEFAHLGEPGKSPLRDREKGKWGQKLSTVKNTVKKAITLSHQFSKLGELEGVDFELATHHDGKTLDLDTTYPVFVFDPNKRQDARFLKVGDLLNLEPEKVPGIVAANPDKVTPYHALLSTLSRGKKEPDSKTDESKVKPIEIGRVADVINELVALIEKDDANAPAIISKFLGKGRTADNVYNFGKFYLFMQAEVWPAIEPEFRHVETQRLAADRKAKEEQAAKNAA